MTKGLKNKIKCLEQALQNCKNEDYPVFIKEFSPWHLGGSCFWMMLDKYESFAVKIPNSQRLMEILDTCKKELNKIMLYKKQ